MNATPGSDAAPAEPVAPAVRRYLTLLFADLCGSTQLAGAMEAEHYAEILGQLRELYRDIVASHGGTVVRIQGDGVLAIFGHPEALEDDGRRAAEAALELHAAVRGLRPDRPLPRESTLRLHTGIHAGLVLLGQGDLVRGRFELMGNASNIAARLSDAAQADEILVSDETLGPERQLFIAGPRRHLVLQGLANPVVVLPLLGQAPAKVRFEVLPQRRLLPFVGRHAEVRRLEGALHDALGGHARFIAIAGSAGLGKTRLAEEFLRRCAEAGFRVHRAFCEAHRGATPLRPFLQILHTLFEIPADADGAFAATQVEAGLRAMVPERMPSLPVLLRAMAIDDPRGDARRPRDAAGVEALPDVLCDLLSALARKQPQVVFVDDWQWADDATHRVFDAIRRLAPAAILTFVAIRGSTAGDPTLHPSETLELPPLSHDEAAQTIEQLLPAVNPFLADQIRLYAGGNPLFLEELCHCAADDAEVRRSGRLQRGAAWLNVLFESRVARLPATQAALVRSAAVIGNAMPVWLFESITGHAADDPAVRRLAELDLIFPGEHPGTLRFKHGIARDVIYDAVGLYQRKALHLRIAETLQERARAAPGEDHSEALAYHFEAADLPEQAARHAEQAGDKAMAASALDRAQAHYRAALAALDRCEPGAQLASRWNAVSERLGLACVFNPSRSDLPLFERAVALAERGGNIATIAKATYWLGYIHYALGDARQALQSTERALGAAQLAGDDRLLVQVRATLGQARAAAAQYGPALALLDDAIAVKRAHRSGAGLAVGLAYSLACRGAVLGDQGQFAAALASFDEALDLLRGTRHEVHASVHGLRAAVLLWQGRWDEARQSAVEASRIGEQVRSLFTLSMGRTAAAFADWMLRPNPAALQALQDASDWLTPGGVTLFRSFNHGWLAEGLAGSGRRREARVHVAHAMRRERERDLIGGAMAFRAMARLEAHSANAALAARWLQRARANALARESAHEQAVNTLCEAEIALGAGRPEVAAPLLDAAQRAFAPLDMVWHRDRAAELRRRL